MRAAPSMTLVPPATEPVADVAAMVVSREGRARLQEGLRGRARLHVAATWRELLALVTGGQMSVVVVELRDAEGVPAAPTVRRLRTAFPLVPVLAYCSLPQPDAGDILTTAQAGVSELIFRGFDDVGVALRNALARAADDCVGHLVLDEIGPGLPAVVRPVVEYCLSTARQAPTVDDVARALGMHRRTLSRRLAQAGMPSPQAIIGWCRLLLAAHLIEHVGRPLEQIALDLNFPSAASLRNMLARYSGLKPREVRGRDGFAGVLRAFRAALLAGAASEEPARPAATGAAGAAQVRTA